MLNMAKSASGTGAPVPAGSDAALLLVCVGGCRTVRGVLLARAAGDVIRQGESYQVSSQAGEHPHGSTEWLHDAVQELLHVALNAPALTVSDVTRSQQH